MKIAVCYDNGQVFQHFGHTEQFKIYEVEYDAVVSSKVIDSNGAGHGALAGVLAEEGINVLICGGMGAGAQAALADAGIEVISGITGDVDEAIVAYLNGQLESAGVNCDHHDHEEGHSCGDGCGSNCGGGCSGCRPAPMEGPNVGKSVKVHYRGTFNDGTQFDSSYDRGETLAFVCGTGMMIRGFDEAVATMTLGEKKTIHLMPEEAYGEADPEAILTIAIAELPGSEELEVGQQVYLQGEMGQTFPVRVTAKDDVMITLDANHEMAGKELNFEIELVEIG